MQRAGQRPDGARQRGRHVGAGRRDHARGEGGGVHAVLGGRDPVGVDRLHVAGVGLAAPADQEALGDRAGLVDLALGHRLLADAAGRLGHEAERHHRHAREVVAGLLVGDVDQLAGGPTRSRASRARPAGPRAGRRCARPAGAARRAACPGSKLPSTSSPQTFSNGTVPDQVLDVDAAVAERPALAVGLGDLGVERDDALEARGHLDHVGHALRISLRPRRPP